MTNNFAQSPKVRRRIAIILAAALILWTAFTVRFRLFITPPGETSPILITEARDYYFDKSSIASKEYEFELFVYKDLWLSLPNVTEIVTTDEIDGADIDFGVAPRICYATIDGQRIDTKTPKNSAQQAIFEKTLKEVCAAEWERACRRVCADMVIWLYFGFALFSWRRCTKEANHADLLSDAY